MIGKITYINLPKRFGFLKSKDSESLYFRIINSDFQMNVEDEVTYDEKETSRGKIAINIRKIYTSTSGILFIPRFNQSHIHLNLDYFLPRIIDLIPIGNSTDYIEYEHEFDEIIGETICIPTSANDKIIYCIRKGRNGHSRFIIGSKPQKSKHLFVALKKIDIGYIIITIFIGKKAGKEPWDENATDADLQFWKDNALIFNKEDIVDGSETTECPWVLNNPSICHIRNKISSHPSNKPAQKF